ncbi:MFS transporter [Celerinatantimonas sp. YJH-8]|uniref:MFS transporter n=1 Tax=Celerinatantimonas sp. YJH-8 TaxID=3228714 RepID=UPI0038BF51C5
MPELSSQQRVFQIFSVVMFTFVCYLSVALPLAVLPGYVHNDLGFNSIMAGVVISAQSLATLFSRPQAGRYADLWGAKKVVTLGLICCALSGVFYGFGMWMSHLPWVSLGLIIVGRLFLGWGESFTSTGSMLWGMTLVGSRHTAQVISWNGVATYGAIAIGAPLGVWINHSTHLYGLSIFIFVVGLLAMLIAIRRPNVTIVTGSRVPFSQVLGKIWTFGLGLAFGSLGFAVVTTFITLYFAANHWLGAAYTLTAFSIGFVGMRLVLGTSINRYGGLRVSLASFGVEAVGLLLICLAPNAWVAGFGALLTGTGFSLIFPGLGVEAVKYVPEQNQGTALGTYSAFFDLALTIAGPMAGLAITYTGLASIYLYAAILVIVAALMVRQMVVRRARLMLPH